MADEKYAGLAEANWPEVVRRIRARTPARLLAGRAGAAYLTGTQLELREAHAAAKDAVRAELNVGALFSARFWEEWNLFEVSTRVASREEFLLRPDLGRCFSDASRKAILERCPKGTDFQIVIGDGLSVPAIAAHAPPLMAFLREYVMERGWSLGRPFVVRHCRVGILNEIGGLLAPGVVVLLIGERPGLATADSLSAYMAYCPNSNHTDANRNLVSNIHSRGLSPQEAADRILRLSELMRLTRTSGFNLKFDAPNPVLRVE